MHAVGCQLNLFQRWDAYEQVGQLGRDEPAVGKEYHLDAKTARIKVQVGEIRAQERFSAGKADRQRAQFGSLPDDILPLLRGKLRCLAAISLTGRLM